jgi:hypothetical protein
MAHDSLSTYEQLMQDPKRRQKFEEGYQKFVLVEILIPLLENSEVPVRVLAKAAGVSPTVIQEIKSGRKEGISYPTFLAIVGALGYQATLQVKRRRSTTSRRTHPLRPNKRSVRISRRKKTPH